MSSQALGCPACGPGHPADERFCLRCGMPLTALGGTPVEAPASEAHGRARKIDPAYTEGELVRVAGGRHQAEAELIQGMLLEEGVPSILRRTRGFDVPDMLAAGPRDVLVPAAGARAAQDVLQQADMAPREGPPPKPGDQARRALTLVVVILLGALLTALVTWALLQAGA